MDMALFLLAFALFWKSSHSIKCYKCTPEQEGYVLIPNCRHFNGNGSFVVDCNLSTMCFKRETTLDLGNGVQSKIEERGCASQTMSDDQRKINGKWTHVDDIHEVYAEGCSEQPSTYQRATHTVDCYCRGDLCNSAAFTIPNLASITAILTLWLVAR